MSDWVKIGNHFYNLGTATRVDLNPNGKEAIIHWGLSEVEFHNVSPSSVVEATRQVRCGGVSSLA